MIALAYKRHAIYVEKEWELCEFFSMYLQTTLPSIFKAYTAPRELPDDLMVRDAMDHDDMNVGTIEVTEVKYHLSPFAFHEPPAYDDIPFHLVGVGLGLGNTQVDSRAKAQLARPHKIFSPYFVSFFSQSKIIVVP